MPFLLALSIFALEKSGWLVPFLNNRKGQIVCALIRYCAPLRHQKLLPTLQGKQSPQGEQ